MQDAHETAATTPDRILRGLLNILSLVALLYIFLAAIAMFGVAFKLMGKEVSENLIATTSHPVLGLMIGLLATSLIQSSSSTTSIVVGMVSGGVLTVTNAIPIIMGANMGTTVTNTLVAMTTINRRTEFQRAFAGATMHDFFNLMSIMILFPLEMGTHFLQKGATWLSGQLVGAQGAEFPNPVKDAVKPTVSAIQDLLTGPVGLHQGAAAVIMLVLALAALFFALTSLSRLLKKLVLNQAEGVFTRTLCNNNFAAMLMGLAVTIAVQSSSITTSLLVPLIGAGIIPLESGFAATLGANVGTTVTALLASLTGTPAAVTVALVHLMFNLSGILIIYPVPWIRRIPLNLARGLAAATARRRYFALVYMIGVFFLLPLVFVLVDKMIRGS
ncbi:sodium dependent phosphate transporter [bacterium CG17_big_fil_post_rev_8_21_14_2_50_64_8]|nr:MAG: sodium dependent phosphate transporter [bacterium CG17_big_fil_post_rev_8_21_14_2_50_64_8]PJA73825.1 MAG: sodium dependent phosphate transporter [bacterium CG_4_9_14_3_um_filter_65_15]